MKKKYLIITMLILAVGFAAVSTMLYLNGTIGFSTNKDDFNVVFSHASIDNGTANITSVNKQDDKISFSINELKKVDEPVTLYYEVTNLSTQYKADTSIKCYMIDDDKNYLNNLISLTGKFDDKNIIFGSNETNASSSESVKINASDTKKGYIKATLLKSFVGEGDSMEANLNVECKLIADADEDTNITTMDASLMSISGVIKDKNNNLQKGMDLVIYSDTPHYVTTDRNGYFYVDGLEPGEHEIYYSKKGYKNKTKEEIIANATLKMIVTTNGTVNSLIKDYKLEEFETGVDLEDKSDNTPNYITSGVYTLEDTNYDESPSFGEKICIGSTNEQCFHIYKIADDKLYLLAQYNINIGSYKNSAVADNIQHSSITGSHRTKSGIDTTVHYGTVSFGNSKYWTSSTEIDITNSGNNFYSYLTSYKNILENTYNASINNITILSTKDFDYMYNYLNGTENEVVAHSSWLQSWGPEWLYTTSYWLKTAYLNDWVYHVCDDGYYYDCGRANSVYYGIRPAIDIDNCFE